MNEHLLGLADDELIIGWRDSEWTGIAPMLEEDVAFSSIAQNEIGHARALYQLLSDGADALAFDRPPDEYRCSPLVQLRFVPDWDELRSVVTGHGPMTAERLEFRRMSREETAWVRRALLAEAA